MRTFARPTALLGALSFLILAGCDAAAPADAESLGATDASAVASGAAAGAHAAAGATCRGTLGSVTVENVIVPDGATCTLQGTTVQGNVFVYTNSRLRSYGARIGGNIQAENARQVLVRDETIVGGNIQAKQGQAVTILQTRVDGDIQIEQNNGAVKLNKNVVGGNMQVFQNTGGVVIKRNRIEENLQCKQNNPAPTGGGNVAGDKEDQCRNL